MLRRLVAWWPPRRRDVVLFLIAAAFVAGYLGLLPNVDDAADRLAGRLAAPEQFTDPTARRSEALLVMFCFLVMTPFVALSVCFLIGVAVMILAALVEPLTRALHLPKATSQFLAVMALAGVAYAKTELWWPHSIRLLGLLAKAYIVAGR